MGASQSTNEGSDAKKPSSHGTDMKICYYDLLGIDRHATEDEVKKAYRRKALELHPDRNYGDIEESTRLFSEIQAAYEVLSDPQERAWYDSHRDAILRGDDDDHADQYEHNARVSTAEDVLRMFTKFDGRLEYSDSSSGFYSMLRTFFSTLADEEVAACNWDGREPPELGSFGHAHDNFEDSVKPFYATWTSFATTKSFSWKDAYRYSEAPDRRVRRMMEKENKKRREEGIREFNDAVRSLVAFVKKRDPRYKLNRQSEAERQKVLREATSAQAARARAQNIANMQEHVVPAWSQVREEDPLDEESEGEQTPEESYECVVCIKTFKSEKQYEMHERSKKHLKNVAQIRRQMRSDNKALDLDSPGDIDISSLEMGDEEMIDEVEASTSPTKSAIDTFPRKPSMNEDRQSLSDNSEGIDDSDAEETNEPPTENGDSNIPEYKPKLAEADPPPHPHEEIISDSNDNETISNVTKLGKAKEKRMKKAAQQAAKSQGPEESQCITCGQIFTSKTKLFSHIKDLDHAQPVLKPIKGGKKRKT